MIVSHGFHATMTARPGRGADVVALLLNAPSLPHADCVVFLVGRSAADPDTVHVTEGWTSERAHRAFFATEPAQALVAALQPLLTGESRYTDEVPVGGKACFAGAPR
jgi:quinol monooxygenase YgiN